MYKNDSGHTLIEVEDYYSDYGSGYCDVCDSDGSDNSNSSEKTVVPPEMTDFGTQMSRDDVLRFEKLALKTAVEVRDNWTQVTPLDKLMYLTPKERQPPKIVRILAKQQQISLKK